MRKLVLVIVLLIMVLCISGCKEQKVSEQPNDPSTETPISEELPEEDVDLGLGEHQVALGDLYFEIPFSKEDVLINRRLENEIIIIDVKSKDNNELLFTYGEKVSENNIKEVFREVTSGKTKVKFHAIIEIDSMNQTITNVRYTAIETIPNTQKREIEFIDYVSRSGKFPAEKIEVLERLILVTDDNYSEEVYEGFVIGVVKEKIIKKPSVEESNKMPHVEGFL